MPPAIVAAVAAVGTAVGGTIGAGLIMYAGTVASALIIGGSLIYGQFQARAARRAARDSYNAGLKDRLVMVPTTDAARSRVYGTVRNVDGPLFRGTWGPNKEKYVIVVAVAGHEVSSIDTVYFGDQAVTLDGDGWVQTAPYGKTVLQTRQASGSLSGGHGSVTLTAFPTGPVFAVVSSSSIVTDVPTSLAVSVAGNVVSYSGSSDLDGYSVSITWQQSVSSSKARVWKFLGSPSQDLSGLLQPKFPSLIQTGAHRFAGIACVVCEFDYDTDVFPSGVPQVSAIVDGAKVFDPRTGLTAWSSNPAVIGRDWAMYQFGGRALASEIDDAAIIVAANGCDVMHAFDLRGSPTPGSVFIPMYTAGIVCKTDVDPWQQLGSIVESMAGKAGWSGGKLKLKAGAYSAPVAEITEDWIADVDDVSITQAPSRTDLVNIIRPTIADAAQDYVVAPATDIRADNYITIDRAEYPREVEYEAVTDQLHAQHVAGVQLRDSRSGLAFTLTCNMRAYPLELFDTVEVTLPRFGWEKKQFEIISWSWGLTDWVKLSLKETAASIFDPDAEFSLIDATPNTSLPKPWDVPQVTGVVVTSGAVLNDGSVVTRTIVSFDPVSSESVRHSGKIEIAWTPAAETLPSGDWPSQTTTGDVGFDEIIGLLSGYYYIFRVRAINSVGVRGQWSSPLVLHKVAVPSRQALTFRSETEPTAPHSKGDLWMTPSTGVVLWWDGSAWQTYASDGGGDWSTLNGRPALFRVAATGANASGQPIGAGLYNGENNSVFYGATRSYTLVKILRADASIQFVRYYDVFANGTDPTAGPGYGFGAAALAADLNATSSAYIVVIYTYDEPLAYRLTAGLAEAMYRCGASKPVFGSPKFQYRSAYILVAIAGCGENSGYEAYQGTEPNDQNAWCDVSFQLQAGNLSVGGSSYTPGSLADYGYTGSLDATTDISLVGRGGVVINGNFASKLSGTNDWSADAVSRDSFTGGCFASAIPLQATNGIMFGLNSDPNADVSYSSLDYAWYMRNDGLLDVFESNVWVTLGIAYTPGDTLAIGYDDVTVRYFQNGVLRRSVAAPKGMKLFFDSSFYEVGARLGNIRFGPLTSNDWASIGNVSVVTQQIYPGAVIDSLVVTGASITITQAAFTPDGQYRRDEIAAISYTPPVDCVVELKVSGNVTYDTSASGLGYVVSVGGIYLDGVLPFVPKDTTTYYSKPGAGATDTRFAIVGTRTFSVVAGTPYRFIFIINKFDPNDTATVKSVEFSLVAMKR